MICMLGGGTLQRAVRRWPPLPPFLGSWQGGCRAAVTLYISVSRARHRHSSAPPYEHLRVTSSLNPSHEPRLQVSSNGCLAHLESELRPSPEPCALFGTPLVASASVCPFNVGQGECIPCAGASQSPLQRSILTGVQRISSTLAPGTAGNYGARPRALHRPRCAHRPPAQTPPPPRQGLHVTHHPAPRSGVRAHQGFITMHPAFVGVKCEVTRHILRFFLLQTRGYCG
jgi:hypothetical protein